MTPLMTDNAQQLVRQMNHYRYNNMQIPKYMREPLALYMAEYQPVGHFLTALLSGDLFDTIQRADDTNIHLLTVYAGFLYNFAPATCYGSREAVKEWLEKKE